MPNRYIWDTNIIGSWQYERNLHHWMILKVGNWLRFQKIEKPSQFNGHSVYGKLEECSDTDQSYTCWKRLQANSISWLQRGVFPVTKYCTVRLILTLITANGWKWISINIITALLNSPLDQKVYLRQPKEFDMPEKADHVWNVNCFSGISKSSCLGPERDFNRC